jgi:YHS domain-containing protein
MKLISLVLFSILIPSLSIGQNVNFYNNNDGVAIKGFDPVAYFQENKAVEGNNTIYYKWSGSIWKFTSEENLEKFKKQPERYAPQYGGFCAYGASENHLSPTDPEAFTIVDNKLYLNYSKKVKELWIKNTEQRILKANEYWLTLKK